MTTPQPTGDDAWMQAWFDDHDALYSRCAAAERERDEAKRDAEHAKAFKNGTHVRNYRGMMDAQARVAELEQEKKDAPLCCKCGTRLYGDDEHGALQARVAELTGLLRECQEHVHKLAPFPYGRVAAAIGDKP